MFQVIRSFLALTVPIVLIGVHFAVMLCFINRWDSVVTITLIPIWIWALAGIILASMTWAAFKSRLALLVCFIWLATALICSDETLPLLRSAKHLVLPPPPVSQPSDSPAGNESQKSIHVVTLNCHQKNDPAKSVRDLAAQFGPGTETEGEGKAQLAAVDVVFLQETPSDEVIQEITRTLFGSEGTWVSHQGCAILARGRLERIELKLDLARETPGTQIAAVLEIDPGIQVELVNVHLKRSIMRYDVWRSDAWTANTSVRIANRSRLRAILKNLPERVVSQPRIVGGDFGTPYNDDIYRVLKRDHRDAFREVGSGWGNTFPAKYPLLRIDQFWISNQLTPLSGQVRQLDDSDHRLVGLHLRLPAAKGFLALR